MNKSADENKKELMDEYKTTSNRLQNSVIILLGFLFLIFFLILSPYYFLTDSYKLAQNIKFYSDKINENFDLNRHILQDYKQYNEGTKKLLNNVTTYTNVLEKVKKLYNDTQYINGTDFSSLKKNIEHEIFSCLYTYCIIKLRCRVLFALVEYCYCFICCCSCYSAETR